MDEKLPIHAGKKTFSFGLALILLDFAPHIQELMVEFFPEVMSAYGLSLIGAVVIGLRLWTKKPINFGRK